MGIEVSWEQKEGISIATLAGRIDGSNAGATQDMLESGIGPEDRALILDLEKVSFLRSAGLRVGLRMARKFDKPGRQFGICTLPIQSGMFSRSAALTGSSRSLHPRMRQSTPSRPVRPFSFWAGGGLSGRPKR